MNNDQNVTIFTVTNDKMGTSVDISDSKVSLPDYLDHSVECLLTIDPDIDRRSRLLINESIKHIRSYLNKRSIEYRELEEREYIIAEGEKKLKDAKEFIYDARQKIQKELIDLEKDKDHVRRRDAELTKDSQSREIFEGMLHGLVEREKIIAMREYEISQKESKSFDNSNLIDTLKGHIKKLENDNQLLQNEGLSPSMRKFQDTQMDYLRQEIASLKESLYISQENLKQSEEKRIQEVNILNEQTQHSIERRKILEGSVEKLEKDMLMLEQNNDDRISKLAQSREKAHNKIIELEEIFENQRTNIEKKEIEILNLTEEVRVARRQQDSLKRCLNNQDITSESILQSFLKEKLDLNDRIISLEASLQSRQVEIHTLNESLQIETRAKLKVLNEYEAIQKDLQRETTLRSNLEASLSARDSQLVAECSACSIRRQEPSPLAVSSWISGLLHNVLKNSIDIWESELLELHEESTGAPNTNGTETTDAVANLKEVKRSTQPKHAIHKVSQDIAAFTTQLTKNNTEAMNNESSIRMPYGLQFSSPTCNLKTLSGNIPSLLSSFVTRLDMAVHASLKNLDMLKSEKNFVRKKMEELSRVSASEKAVFEGLTKSLEMQVKDLSDSLLKKDRELNQNTALTTVKSQRIEQLELEFGAQEISVENLKITHAEETIKLKSQIAQTEGFLKLSQNQIQILTLEKEEIEKCKLNIEEQMSTLVDQNRIHLQSISSEKNAQMKELTKNLMSVEEKLRIMQHKFQVTTTAKSEVEKELESNIQYLSTTQQNYLETKNFIADLTSELDRLKQGQLATEMLINPLREENNFLLQQHQDCDEKILQFEEEKIVFKRNNDSLEAKLKDCEINYKNQFSKQLMHIEQLTDELTDLKCRMRSWRRIAEEREGALVASREDLKKMLESKIDSLQSDMDALSTLSKESHPPKPYGSHQNFSTKTNFAIPLPSLRKDGAAAVFNHNDEHNKDSTFMHLRNNLFSNALQSNTLVGKEKGNGCDCNCSAVLDELAIMLETIDPNTKIVQLNSINNHQSIGKMHV